MKFKETPPAGLVKFWECTEGKMHFTIMYDVQQKVKGYNAYVRPRHNAPGKGEKIIGRDLASLAQAKHFCRNYFEVNNK